MARLITVEPVLVGVMMFLAMYATTSNEYIYHYLSKIHGLANETRSNECNTTDVSPDEKHLQHQVSAEASEWGLYLNIAGLVPSLITTPLTASWGDVVGRRYPLILASFGLLVLGIVYLIVFSYELPLYILIFGRIFSGFCGYFPGMLASAFAYLSDISSYNNRTIKVAIIELSMAFGSIFSSLISGIWVDAQGYVPPMFFLVSIMLASIFYIAIILPESISVENDSILWKLKCLFSSEPIFKVWNLLKLHKQRTINIVIVMFCFFLQICCFSGMINILPIIGLSPPLCFSNTYIGYVTACFAGGFLFGIVCLKLFKYVLKEIWIVLIATMSLITSMLILAFANSSWLFILGVSTAFLQSMATVIFRSLVSRLVNPDEQGAVFSLIACSESLSGLVASFLFNGVYAATVSTFSSTVMFVTILLQMIIFSVFGFSYNKIEISIKQKEENIYRQINEQLEAT